MREYGSRTDADWVALRDAVPSFAAHWDAYTARRRYNPLDVGMNFLEFKSHLADVVGADPESLSALFIAMERHSPGNEDALDRTISILETVAKAAEEHGIDMRRLARLLPGPVTRGAWRQALTWTHRECTWDDERGLVPDWLPPVPVGRVRVADVPRTNSELHAFPVDVELLSGTLQPGQFVWMTHNSCFHSGRQIVAVEPLPAPPEAPARVRLMLAYHHTERPDEQPSVGEMWYDTDEVLEIIEQLPPEMERLYATPDEQ